MRRGSTFTAPVVDNDRLFDTTQPVLVINMTQVMSPAKLGLNLKPPSIA